MKKFCIFILSLFMLSCVQTIITQEWDYESAKASLPTPAGASNAKVSLLVEDDTWVSLNDEKYVHDFKSIEKNSKIDKVFKVKVEDSNISVDKIVIPAVISEYWTVTSSRADNIVTFNVSNQDGASDGSYLATIAIEIGNTSYYFGVLGKQVDRFQHPVASLWPAKDVLFDNTLKFAVTLTTQDYISNDATWSYTGSAKKETNQMISIPFKTGGTAKFVLPTTVELGYYAFQLKSNNPTTKEAKLILKNNDGVKKIEISLGALDGNWTEYGILLTAEKLRLYKGDGTYTDRVINGETTSIQNRELILSRNLSLEDISSLPVSSVELSVPATTETNYLLIEQAAYYESNFVNETTAPIVQIGGVTYQRVLKIDFAGIEGLKSADHATLKNGDFFINNAWLDNNENLTTVNEKVTNENSFTDPNAKVELTGDKDFASINDNALYLYHKPNTRTNISVSLPPELSATCRYVEIRSFKFYTSGPYNTSLLIYANNPGITNQCMYRFPQYMKSGGNNQMRSVVEEVSSWKKLFTGNFKNLGDYSNKTWNKWGFAKGADNLTYYKDGVKVAEWKTSDGKGGYTNFTLDTFNNLANFAIANEYDSSSTAGFTSGDYVKVSYIAFYAEKN